MRENGSQQGDGKSSDAPAWMAPRGGVWRIKGDAKRVHDNPYFHIDQYDAVAPTGADAGYWVVGRKFLSVGVIPLHEDGTITLVGQWRFPFGTYSWELPEGGAPHGEDPLDGAKRELGEETRLKAEHWHQILVMQLTNASSDERAIGYLATGLSPTDVESEDATEDLAIERVPFREALAQVTAGRIEDAITVAMLLRLHHMAVTGDLHPDLAQAVLR